MLGVWGSERYRSTVANKVTPIIRPRRLVINPPLHAVKVSRIDDKQYDDELQEAFRPTDPCSKNKKKPGSRGKSFPCMLLRKNYLLCMVRSPAKKTLDTSWWLNTPQTLIQQYTKSKPEPNNLVQTLPSCLSQAINKSSQKNNTHTHIRNIADMSYTADTPLRSTSHYSRNMSN